MFSIPCYVISNDWANTKVRVFTLMLEISSRKPFYILDPATRFSFFGVGRKEPHPMRVRDGVLDVVVIFLTLALCVSCTGT